MKRILITGGAGFIGANLIRVLLKDAKSQITIIDNLMTGKKFNLDGLKPDIDFIKADICRIALESLEGHDEIYHLASLASPTAYQRNPVITMDTCYIGTKKVLEYAKKFQSKVVFTSTSEVYGDPLVTPQSESYYGNVSTVTPRSCYNEGKRIAETLCYEYHKLGVDVKIARLFNTYGPYMTVEDGRVVPNFICQAIQNKPLTIYGDGNQTRSFCFVKDIVECLVEVMSMIPKEFAVVNIGSDLELSILKIAKKIIKITNANSQIQYLPLPIADPQRRKPDLTNIKKILGWQPQIDIDDGLLMTVEYFNNFLIGLLDKRNSGYPALKKIFLSR